MKNDNQEQIVATSLNQVNALQATNFISRILSANRVANLLGSPGIGKSDIIKEIAKKYALKVIDFRLAQADPTDLNNY